MSDRDTFDNAILTELDRVVAAATPPRVMWGGARARQRASRVYTCANLLRRRCGSHVEWAERGVRKRYGIIPNRLREILSAKGDGPPQFAKYSVRQEGYERLYPSYLKARDWAAGVA